MEACGCPRGYPKKEWRRSEGGKVEELFLLHTGRCPLMDAAVRVRKAAQR